MSYKFRRLRNFATHEIDEADSDEVEEVEMTDFERRQMKHAMRESRRVFEEGRHGHEMGGTSSQPSGAGIKRGPIQSFSIREGPNIPPKGIDSYMFPSKQKSIKVCFPLKVQRKWVKQSLNFFFSMEYLSMQLIVGLTINL